MVIKVNSGRASDSYTKAERPSVALPFIMDEIIGDNDLWENISRFSTLRGRALFVDKCSHLND